MRSTSFSSENMGKHKSSQSSTPVGLDALQLDDMANLKRPVSSTLKANGENYMKQETYPKFPQQKSSLHPEYTHAAMDNNSHANTNAEENVSLNSSEIRFKQRTSPDGVESVKSKDNENEEKA